MSNNNTVKVLQSLTKSYESGKYEEALTLILENKNEFDKEIFHYNYGVLKASQKKYAVARYHVEKSISLGFDDQLAFQSLKQLEVQLNNSNLYLENSKFDRGLSLFQSISVEYFFLLFSIIFFLLVVGNIKKILKIKTASILFFLLIIIPSLSVYFMKNCYKSAIVLSDVEARIGPSKIYEKVYKYNAGSKVIVGKRFNNWIKVVSPEKYKGWIEKDKLGFL